MLVANPPQQMLLGNSSLGLRGDEVVNDRHDEAKEADDEQRHARGGLSEVTEHDAEPGEVSIREGSRGEAQSREDGHAEDRKSVV